MWKLVDIEAENLCAFRRFSYTLMQGVTTLVFGDNRDNDSQRSNGSGKSALIEAIAFGMTGSTLRKVRGEEIINDGADECRVCLRFRNDGVDEVFRVERHIARKGGSTVECRIYRGGIAVMTDEAVQASVDAYNRFILEKLGITREELFSTFILSKHKYQDFLSAPDTQKKEIINGFSNGILVDRAIEKVVADLVPVEKELQEAALETAGIDGRIEMLTEQIEQEEEALTEKARTREERIAGMKEAIQGKSAVIREKKSRLEELHERMKGLESAEQVLQVVEGEDVPVDGCLKKVGAVFADFALEGLTDWDEVLKRSYQEVAEAERELKLLKADVAEISLSLKEFTKDCEGLRERYARLCRGNERKVRECDVRMRELAAKLTDAGDRLNVLRHRRRELVAETERLKGQLSGAICCPACQHEFLLADDGFDIASARKLLSEQKAELQQVESVILECQHEMEITEEEQDEVREQKRVFCLERDAVSEELSRADASVQRTSNQLYKAEQRQNRVETELATLRDEVEGVRRKLFDEAFALVDDACRRTEREERQTAEEIRGAESGIATLRETIAELSCVSASDTIAGLQASLKRYRALSAQAVARKEQAEERLYRLQEQQERFVQFKSYLANTKIEALNRITNEFLESIGSDIRLRLSGFTLLKTGKIREKISASLIRDGVDCGSFGKFSQGEAARVHLATILAMQRLVNGGCEVDKGLDLLVLDEILDAMDESGLANTFYALNRLGITSLVVSHGNVAEGYEHKLVIVKENGESYIG